VNRPAFQFDPEWRTTLLTLLLLPALVMLGFWQLQRSDEKALLAGIFERRQVQAPVSLQELDAQSPEALAYLPVTVSGEFVAGSDFLLDNRIHRGKFGYEVLSLLRLAQSEDAVLVNRGWVAGDSARLRLPELPQVAGLVTLRAHVYVAPGETYMLGEQTLEDGWPKRIQAVEMDKLTAAVDENSLFPYTVRVDPGQPGALTVDWKIVNMSPEKHTGYAVQWFTMAAVLAILYLLRSSNLWLWLGNSKRNDGRD
jgi:surfeit locus 1 family protein